MMKTLSRFLDIRDGEGGRVGIITFLLFFLIAANNIIKILRDSVFLSHHSVSELPYIYILVAFLAGAIIATYTKFTANLSILRLILATNAIILSNIIFFWFLLTYFDPGWSHYAFYIWSAIAGAISVAQIWTVVNEIFSSHEGVRLFGILTAGGTVGGTAAAFGAKWAVERSFETNHLLWFVAACYLAVSVLVLWVDRRVKGKYLNKKLETSPNPSRDRVTDIRTIPGSSRYLKGIALLILVSVIVSTLIDFEFKAAAKQAYRSKDTLAIFFGAYYGWLSVTTFFAQLFLTRKTLSILGLFPSLYITPGALLTGLLAMLMWPGILAAALTRMTDAALRNSLHRSNMEILYIPLSLSVKKRVKTFLDVVVERVGDAAAGIIILLVGILSANGYVSYVHLLSVAFILVWILFIPFLRIRHDHTIRKQTRSPDTVSEQAWPGSNSTKRSMEL